MLGSAGVIVGTAVQLVDAQGSRRWLWITLVVVGAVVAVPALVLQSPWWTERQRRRIERAHHDRERQIDERHFLTYGRGVVRPDWRGSYFTGRTAAIRALVGFLDGDPAVGGGRVRAVVGGPGSGKSAVVGRLVILANLDMRRGERDVGSAVPTVGVIDGAIHARGKDVTQILGGLAECAGFGGNWIDGVGPHVAGVDELILALRGRRPPVTVVLDAVDEAVEPERVVREVIGPLTDSSPDVGIRLVLGMRPHLLRLLALPGAAVIDLDDERYFEPTDVVEYALACLLLSTDPLAELHARQQGHSTLADRVVALNADQPWSAPWVRGRPVHPHQVIGRHYGEVGAIAVAEIDGQIWVVTGDSRGTVGIWDLERGMPVDAPVAVPAGEISAVAVTHLPRTGPVVVFGGDAGLWRLRLADRDLGPLVTDTGVRAVVMARARDQVLVVWGDGEGRIGIHDLATGAYRRQPFDAHSGGVEALTTTEIDRATVIVSGGADGTAAAWTLPEGTLVARMAMVSAQPVVTVAPHGPHSGTVTAGGLDGVPSTWNLTTRRPVSDRVLGYDGWLSCLSITSDRPAAVGGAYDGRVLVWSDASPTGSDPASGVDYPNLVMAGHDGWVTAVAVAHYAERDVVVSGGLDGTVRAWSVDETVVPAGDGDAHDGELTSLTLLAGLTDQVVVVSGGTDGTVRLWRTADGKPADDPILAHEHGVRAVAATVLSGRPTIASGGLDGTVRVWDATTRQPVGGQFQAHSQVVRAAQLLLVEGRPVLVTGGDGGVRRWNPLTGHSFGAALAPDRDIRALTFTLVDRRPVLVAGTDHGIYRWDLLTGEQIGSVLAAGEQFDAVAAIVVRGVAMVFGGGDEPDLRCWTMTSGSAVTLASVTSYRVRSLTVARTGNRPTLVVGDDHGVSTVSVGSGGQLRRVRLGFGATALAAETSSSLLIGSRRGLYHVTLAEGE